VTGHVFDRPVRAQCVVCHTGCLAGVTEPEVRTLTDTGRRGGHPMRARRNERGKTMEGRRQAQKGDRLELAVAALRSGQAKAQGPSVEAVPSLRTSMDGPSEVPH